MSGQNYSTERGRLELFKGRVLARAVLLEMLTRIGDTHDIPKNQSKNIKVKRFLPFGGVDNQFIQAGGDADFVQQHQIADGVTPSPDSVRSIDIEATLQQIGCLFSYTDQFYELHEDASQYLGEMDQQVAERITLCREMMNWGVVKTCSNQFFGGTGSDVSTVNGPLTSKLANLFVNTIRRNNGGFTKTILASSPNYGTVAVPRGFIAYAHPDLEPTLRGMEDQGFLPAEKYGNIREAMGDNEIGSFGALRIMVSPNLTYMPDAGAPVGTWTGSGVGRSDGGTNLNVYPILVVGRGNSGGQPFGQVRLRGRQSMAVTNKPLDKVDSGDPLAQRGYVGAKTYHTAMLQNDGWMGMFYVATGDE